MVDPSLAISIDRTALSLSPLVFGCSGDVDLGITSYREPAEQSRVVYAPSSEFVDGDLPLGATLQQTILPFSFFTDVDTEAESRALVAQVRAAVRQAIEFEVTVTVSGAPAETWVCNPGSVTPEEGRDYMNLRDADPTWAVVLPCYPIRSVA